MIPFILLHRLFNFILDVRFTAAFILYYCTCADSIKFVMKYCLRSKQASMRR